MTRLTSWITGAMKSPRRSTASAGAGRKGAATTGKPSARLTAVAIHEASHAVVAVMVGLRAHAALHGTKEGHGVTDIDAPTGGDADGRVLLALVAGSVGEGRLLDQPRRWRVAREDAKAIARLIGPMDERGARRLAEAKDGAAELVRVRAVWTAIEAVARRLADEGSASDAAIREALRAAGARPLSRSSAAAGEGRRSGRAGPSRR